MWLSPHVGAELLWPNFPFFPCLPARWLSHRDPGGLALPRMHGFAKCLDPVRHHGLLFECERDARCGRHWCYSRHVHGPLASPCSRFEAALACAHSSNQRTGYPKHAESPAGFCRTRVRPAFCSIQGLGMFCIEACNVCHLLACLTQEGIRRFNSMCISDKDASGTIVPLASTHNQHVKKQLARNLSEFFESQDPGVGSSLPTQAADMGRRVLRAHLGSTSSWRP